MNAARLVLPALRARDGNFIHEAETIESAITLGVGGFIIFGGSRESASDLTTRLQRYAGYPLLIAADLERGVGQQFLGMTPLPPPAALAQLEDPDAIRLAGAITAREARRMGINWVFAPVADLDIEARNPIVQTRSFGRDPERVARAVREWVMGCQEAGALACVKHFPGHGRTVHDSHASLPIVTADAAAMENDLLPFRAAIGAGVASVMTAHVAYPALDPSGLPATRSGRIIRMLRDDLGFDGAVVTDALVMGGATSGSTEAAAVSEVIDAGVDLLLYPKDVSVVIASLTLRAERFPIFAERIAAALRRRNALLARIPFQPEEGNPERDQAMSEEMASTLIAQGVLRGTVPRLRAPLNLVLIDDDVDGDWPASSNAVVGEALRNAGEVLGPGGSKVVLAFCEARAGKGRGGFGPRTQDLLQQHQDADVIILFGHSRLLEMIPGSAPVIGAWHRQPLMQRAVARQLAGWIA